MKQKRFYRNTTKASKPEYGDVAYGYQGKPVGDSKPEVGISIKSLRALPKNSYSVQADPYTAALPGSEPYALLNQFNRTIGGFYGGDRNIDGGNVQQYANSLRSKFLNYCDFIRMKIGINYQYIPVLPVQPNANGGYAGKGLIDEQRRSIAEATSTLQSTTFTQMAIYDYAIATDMPMGSAKADATQWIDSSKTQLPVYSDLNDVIFGASRFYQIFWLKTLGIFDWHNSFRLKMGTMIRSAWNREVPQLNSLFGLFKKKSFLSLLNSISLSFPGEYIDREFALQYAKTCLIPSRRSNSITDPLLEIQTDYNLPQHFALLLKVTQNGETTYTKIFDATSDLKASVSGLTDVTFTEACDKIMTLLSAEDTMRWARNEFKASTDNDNLRFNEVKRHLDVVQWCITKVKTLFTDIREVYDTVARTGVMTWYKGFRPSITREDDSALFRNLIVDDIIRLAMGGANKVTYNEDTKRWATFSLWNMYDGIPEYDMWSGGAFLTLSLKKKEIGGEDIDGTLNYLPVCLTNAYGEADITLHCVTRKGTEYDVKSIEIALNDYVSTRRLVPLESQASLTARIPSITPSQSTSEIANDFSALIKTLTQVVGYVHLNTANPNINIDPDIFAVYQIEIEDITNMMISYARSSSPFRGVVNVHEYVGFLGTVAAGRNTTTTAIKSNNVSA